RFFPGVANGNALSANPTVDRSGNPVAPAGATGPLQTVSVFGKDPLHLTADTTGGVQHTLSYLPLPNNYLVGDGLNTGGFTWNRPVPVNFELYEGRVDYVFDEKERLSITLNHQSYHSFNVATPPPFPTVPGQADPTETTQYSAALTSVFRTNLLNEARMGVFRYRTVVQTPYDPDTPGSKGFLPIVSGVPTLISLASISNVYGSSTTNFGIPGNYLNPTYQYGDNLTWIKGRHSFKGGVQARYISLAGFDFSAPTLPIVGIGSPAIAPIVNINT